MNESPGGHCSRSTTCVNPPRSMPNGEFVNHRVARTGNGRGFKDFVRAWFPPAIIRLVQHGLDFVRPAPWEYVSDHWPANPQARGWNVSSIAELQKSKWETYVKRLGGSQPLGLNHEASMKREATDIRDHNLIMTYGYVLASAVQRGEQLSLLDWGGGMGHYYLLSKALLPQIEIDYACYDLPLLCEAGREVLPQVRFCERPDQCFSREYDLVLASSSLWYEQDWRVLLDKLVKAASPYLYVTRMIFVEQAPSYVVIQRPSAMGYRTEYLCWILNQREFVDYVLSRGMALVREFFLCSAPRIHRAPEQGTMKGFLFRKIDGSQVAR